MNDIGMEKSSYGPFERFLFIFLIPVVFTLFLILLLLSIVDRNFMNGVLTVANKIPYVASVIPDPAAESDDPNMPSLGSDGKLVADLKKQLAEKEAIISDYEAKDLEKDREIANLKKQLQELQAQKAEEMQTQEEYQQRIRELAKLFSEMNSTKAAQIFENLTLPEQVLILNELDTDERAGILGKMNPQKAAEASIMLKDIHLVEDIELRALQARLEIHDQKTQQTQVAEPLSLAELAGTLANMQPGDAAPVVIQMYGTQPEKTLNLLKAMDTGSRSRLMGAVAKINYDTAATIFNRLAN